MATVRQEMSRIRKSQEIHPAIPNVLEKTIEEHGDNGVIAWSGGRCSTVVLHQALQIKPNIKVVFCNTGCEYPETYHFVNKIRLEWNLNFYQTYPTKTFWQCVEEYGLPMSRSMNSGRGAPKCCIYLKEKPMINFVKEHNVSCIITGLRVAESRMRFFTIRGRGQYFYSKRWKSWRCHPIAFWSNDDLNEYVKKYDVPLNCIYEKIPRCGCMPCTSFSGWEKQLAIANPKMYEYVQKLKGQTLIQGFGGT